MLTEVKQKITVTALIFFSTCSHQLLAVHILAASSDWLTTLFARIIIFEMPDVIACTLFQICLKNLFALYNTPKL